MFDEFPKFYHCGNRFAKSDRDFIAGKLARINPAARKAVCDVYTNIYLENFNKGQYALARGLANKMLVDVVKEIGISKLEHDKIVASEKTKAKVKEALDRIRASKPKRSKILDMIDGKVARR